MGPTRPAGADEALRLVTLVPLADSSQVESGGFDGPFVLTL